MIYLITYDKNVLLKSYKPLFEEIKNCSITWWHHLDDTWMIRTQLEVTEVFERLAKHLDEKDRLLIVEIKSNYSGWLRMDAWDWLKEQFYEERGIPKPFRQ